MKFITGNKKTKDQRNDNIVDIKKSWFSEININIPMELSFHRNKHDSVPDSDTSPQFQLENQYEKIQHSNRSSAEFQSVQ